MLAIERDEFRARGMPRDPILPTAERQEGPAQGVQCTHVDGPVPHFRQTFVREGDIHRLRAVRVPVVPGQDSGRAVDEGPGPRCSAAGAAILGSRWLLVRKRPFPIHQDDFEPRDVQCASRLWSGGHGPDPQFRISFAARHDEVLAEQRGIPAPLPRIRAGGWDRPRSTKGGLPAGPRCDPAPVVADRQVAQRAHPGRTRSRSVPATGPRRRADARLRIEPFQARKRVGQRSRRLVVEPQLAQSDEPRRFRVGTGPARCGATGQRLPRRRQAPPQRPRPRRFADDAFAGRQAGPSPARSLPRPTTARPGSVPATPGSPGTKPPSTGDPPADPSRPRDAPPVGSGRAIAPHPRPGSASAPGAARP